MKYLLQAGKGQMAMFSHARPISEVVKDEKTPPKIKKLLEEIEPIKKYGESHGLKPTKNYTEYVHLNRSAAVWVVSASEALRFHSKEWSFPIVGRFPYLGWFDRKDAQEFAEELKQEGWDVDLRGASAYSTLGWFRDAILSTMISQGESSLGDLINVVLHESVHATLYIKGQAFFNESLASFIADQLTLEYLDQTRGKDSLEKKTYVESEKYREKVEIKFHETYQKLAQLYSSTQSNDQKVSEKKLLIEALQLELKWKRDINNATLIQYKTYHTGQEEFSALLKSCDGNWERFLASLNRLTDSSFKQSQQDDLWSLLNPLIKSGCQ